MRVLIVILLLIVTFVSVVIYIGRKRRIMANSNPIDGLHAGGTMGFLLGDSYDFCKSRLQHLNIPIDSNEMENEIHQLIAGNLGSDVCFGSNMFNNILYVRFKFIDKKLDAISINIDYSSIGINEMYIFLQKRISQVLRKEPYPSTKEFTIWQSHPGSITLNIFKDEEGDSLTIYVQKK